MYRHPSCTERHLVHAEDAVAGPSADGATARARVVLNEKRQEAAG